ncbi:MAG TPA: hypothetical protein VL854_11610 [Nitrososphaeraceae archaeon]|nr:hypothetical protein [Nitrososphaeraceae archaeon]
MRKLKALLIGLFIVLGFYLTMNLLTLKSFGEDYKFNMTKELEDEGRTLQLCIFNTKIEIQGIPEFCSTRYGGINSPYGDKIN